MHINVIENSYILFFSILKDSRIEGVFVLPWIHKTIRNWFILRIHFAFKMNALFKSVLHLQITYCIQVYLLKVELKKFNIILKAQKHNIIVSTALEKYSTTIVKYQFYCSLHSKPAFMDFRKQKIWEWECASYQRWNGSLFLQVQAVSGQKGTIWNRFITMGMMEFQNHMFNIQFTCIVAL